MKITFRGWRREVYPHEVKVTPVVIDRGRYRAIENRRSLAWQGGMTALGKVSDLALNGAFLAELNFTPSDLKSWLTNYLISNPEDALRLIAGAEGDAIRHMTKQGTK